MRIIAGKWQSRRLARPPTSGTTPYPDRVREAVFSILGSQLNTGGMLDGLTVADVFAGSGGMGLEALSRGASTCWFFEQGRVAQQTLRSNIDALDAAAQSEIVGGNAWQLLVPIVRQHPVEVVFLDPPYAQSTDPTQAGRVGRLLAALQPLSPRCHVILHHEAKVVYTALDVAAWNIVDQRGYGGNGITIFSHEV